VKEWSKVLCSEDGPVVDRKDIPVVHGVVGNEVVAGKRHDGEVVVDDSLRFITNGF
jgi:hypothetical protein